MKRYMWAAWAVLAISSTSWASMMTAASAGGVGMTGGQNIGRVLVPGMYGGNIGVHISAMDFAMNPVGAVVCGTNQSWTENSNGCGNNNQPNPSCNTGCWPNWPIWIWPWGNVTTSSDSTATTIARGPDSSATAETSGMSVGPGASSSSHSYAQSINP